MCVHVLVHIFYTSRSFLSENMIIVLSWLFLNSNSWQSKHYKTTATKTYTMTISLSIIMSLGLIVKIDLSVPRVVLVLKLHCVQCTWHIAFPYSIQVKWTRVFHSVRSPVWLYLAGSRLLTRTRRWSLCCLVWTLMEALVVDRAQNLTLDRWETMPYFRNSKFVKFAPLFHVYTILDFPITL